MIAAETSPIESREDIPVNAVLEMFHKWLYIGDDYNVVGPLAAVIANFAPGEPDIIGVIGPSGSGKTEFIRSLGDMPNKYVYPVSSITEKTLISGLDENPDRDLIPKLYNNGIYKVLAIKDMTTLLSKSDDSRCQIFADFREMTDGYIRKIFGNGVDKHYETHSSIIFASTNAIERYYSMYSNLGQRLIFIRPVSDPKKAMRRARQNIGNEDIMRDELHGTVMEFLEKIIEVIDRDGLPTISENLESDLFDLFYFLSIARTTIYKDFKGRIDEIPEPEFPTRIAKTVSRLAQVHALIHGRKFVDETDYNFVKRIILDNVPSERLQVLKRLANSWEKVSVIAANARLPTAKTQRILDELQALGIADRLPRGVPDILGDTDNVADRFMINEEFREVVGILTTG